MDEITYERTLARLTYSKKNAPWLMAVLFALLLWLPIAGLFSALGPAAIVIGLLVGAWFGMYVSRIIISLVDGLLLLNKRCQDSFLADERKES